MLIEALNDELISYTRYENNQIYVNSHFIKRKTLILYKLFVFFYIIVCFFDIQTYTGSILIAVNPYKMFDIYNLDTVKRYENNLIGILPP